jgi:hypothetical protein
VAHYVDFHYQLVYSLSMLLAETFHAGSSLRCSDCPSTPFNHAVGDKYISYGITFHQAW